MSGVVEDLWIDGQRCSFRVCGRCRGTGWVASGESWWNRLFGKMLRCGQCHGSGRPNTFGPTPTPPEAPPE